MSLRYDHPEVTKLREMLVTLRNEKDVLTLALSEAKAEMELMERVVKSVEEHLLERPKLYGCRLHKAWLALDARRKGGR